MKAIPFALILFGATIVLMITVDPWIGLGIVSLVIGTTLLCQVK